MLHNMLGFMKKTKHIRHNSQDGVYLSDLNVEELEPEMAALYFPTEYKQTHTSQGSCQMLISQLPVQPYYFDVYTLEIMMFQYRNQLSLMINEPEKLLSWSLSVKKLHKVKTSLTGPIDMFPSN
jgi:hypothetical protein